MKKTSTKRKGMQQVEATATLMSENVVHFLT